MALYCLYRCAEQRWRRVAFDGDRRRGSELIQRLVRQARKDRLVYLILAECRLVLPEAQAPQPDHNVHDGAHNRGWRAASSAGPEEVSRAVWTVGSQGLAKP